MSRNFIGSKIAIITKAQYRYTGVIIGIDAQSSSILLGNVYCFGTENRVAGVSNGHLTGTTVPVMQFANSDIEDLKIVDEDQTPESPARSAGHQQDKQQHHMPVMAPPPPMPPQQPSIHDDPAIVSAVVSTASKDNKTGISPISSRLMHDLRHLTLSNEQSKTAAPTSKQTEGSRIRTDSGELGPSWSLLSPSKWENNTSSQPPQQQKPQQQQQQQQQPSSGKSKFFDDFASNGSNAHVGQSQRFHHHQQQQQQQQHRSNWPSNQFNTHSTQTSGENGVYNEQEDDSALPVRQPFFSDDRPFSQQQQQQARPLQPQYHYQNGRGGNGGGGGSGGGMPQRSFYNNRRPHMSTNYQQRRPGGGNRETFHDSGNGGFDADFDFETSNRNFDKIASEDEFKQQSDYVPSTTTTNVPSRSQFDVDSNTEYTPIYDKKKSFFDNITVEAVPDAPAPIYNRSRNQDTFGNSNSGHYQQRGGGQRRMNNNYRQQRSGDDFYYRQHNNNNNNNGYHYRY